MKVDYATSRLRRLCEQSGLAQRTLGPDSSRLLRTRLADLAAASCLAEIAFGNPHPLKGDRLGEFALNLAGGDRLVFRPADEPVPLTESGAIHWPAVARIVIVFIGDYHE